MEVEKNEMFFNLKEKLQYSVKGDFLDTATIQFKAPSAESFDEALDLSQMVMNSMIDASKNIEEGDEGKRKCVKCKHIMEEPIPEKCPKCDAITEPDIDADAIKVMLMAGQRVKMSDVRAKFDAVAVKCGTFDGEIPITATTLKQLPMTEYVRMLCEYIANFIIPSLV